MNLIVRHGPAPGDTEDAAGRLHSTFTGSFILPLSFENAQRLFGTDGTNAENPDAFVAFVRQIWARVTAPPITGGHVLIGAYSNLECVTSGPLACGSQPEEPLYAPKGYVPLYAVARVKKPANGSADSPAYIDFAVDYRGTSGPGDRAVCPVVFESASAS